MCVTLCVCGGALVFGVGHGRVLGAKHSDAGLECLVVHLECLRKLPLVSKHIPDVVLSAGDMRVVRRKALELSLKGSPAGLITCGNRTHTPYPGTHVDVTHSHKGRSFPNSCLALNSITWPADKARI